MRTRHPFAAARWLLPILTGAVPSHTEGRPLVDYVNTLRGSNSSPEFSYGNTFPAVAVPFGFNFWTPVTEPNSDRWLYTYAAKHIVGFAVSHEPSPWIADHGSLQVMPMLGQLRVDATARMTPFRHEAETARAHYYSVELPEQGITVEISPTNRASKWRFGFARGGDAYLVFNSIDTVHGLASVDEVTRSIRGYVDHNGPRLYFHAQLNRPIRESGVVQGPNATAWVKFDVRAHDTAEMAMATSFISAEQARRNLEQEVGARTFEQVRAEAAADWEGYLRRLEIHGATDEQKVTFYSSFYRTLLYPNSMWEVGNEGPVYFSPYTDRLRSGRIYVNNGFWDTYRAQWPLLSLLIPGQAARMLQGFVTAYEDGGWAPRWTGPGYVDCMVGSSSDIVFADSYLRGVTEFDIQTAFDSMLKNALTHSLDGRVGRKGNDRSIFRGYVPTDFTAEATAWTLEDAINDFGIAQIARVLGDEAHHRYFSNRALRYASTYSASVGFFRGRRADGSWRTTDSVFDPYEWGHEFTEGNAWHYLAAATADPEGMAQLHGGRERFAQKLDALFAASSEFRVGSYGQVIHEMREAQATGMGQYAHSNEPLHSLIYMYNYLQRPAATQRYVRQVVSRLYGSGVGNGRGYLGDEDNGQMSAWYVFSTLGFYPAAPGHAEYVIGSPLFRKAVLHLDNGRHFTVSAPENGPNNVFIQSARLNGQPYTKSYLKHSDIVAGGVLELALGPAPSQWGSSESDVPASVSPMARLDSVGPRFLSDLASGGTATATPAGSNAQQAFDDDSGTHWSSPGSSGRLQYRFGDAKPRTVTLYTVTSAKDRPDADPRSWKLQGSVDCAHWQTLDQRTEQRFKYRQQTRVFPIYDRTPFVCYRFELHAKRGVNLIRVAELELIGE